MKNHIITSILSIAIISLLVILAIRANSDLAAILLNLFLTIFSISIGAWVSRYYSKKSFRSTEQQVLERHAVVAFRLSKNIDELIKLYLGFITSRAKDLGKSKQTTDEQLETLLDTFREYLLTLSKLTLSANDNWRDILPDSQIDEVRQREIDTVQLAENFNLVISESIYEFTEDEFKGEPK